MRVVLDTNVLIAALIARGVCADLLEHCVLHHDIVSSQHILDELQRHLLGKFKYSAQESTEALDLLRSKMELAIPVPLPQPICRDVDDDLILATAVAGNAVCIVTGDKDLLVLKQYQQIEIVGPAQFADFESRQGGAASP
jgi:putative PIN family toxin of toxin-antitoxin system